MQRPPWTTPSGPGRCASSSRLRSAELLEPQPYSSFLQEFLHLGVSYMAPLGLHHNNLKEGMERLRPVGAITRTIPRKAVSIKVRSKHICRFRPRTNNVDVSAGYNIEHCLRCYLIWRSPSNL